MKLHFECSSIFLYLLFLSPYIKPSSSAKILAVAFISSPSHKITYQPLLNELGARGHEVTVVSPVVSKKKSPNVNEILTFDGEIEKERLPSAFERKEKNAFGDPKVIMKMFGDVCSKTIPLKHVQALRNQKFDLILLPTLFNECTAGWIYDFNTSLILLSPTTLLQWTSSQFGIPSPPSFVPNLFLTSYGDKMTFYERTINFVATVALNYVYNWMFVPHMDGIYRDKLNDQSIPSSQEILKNASLVLINSHVSLVPPRPLLPDAIQVGGMHCRPAKPLPKDLEDFVQSSGDDGFILFSMGSAVKGSTMPEAKRKMILGAFSKLKQKVLWKWETETMADLPSNVKLSKWLPQQDVLGHPKIKAFVTHGGFGSITETVYHGVPFVGIPMFGDQDLNVQRAESSGFAITLQYMEFKEEDLFDAVQKVVYEPKYKENVMKLSKIFRDQPEKPLDRAVFWVEYVLRHGGAPHLRSSPARELNAFQYHSLDVIGFLLGIIGIVFWLIFGTLRFILRKLFGSKSGQVKKEASSKKKKN